MGPEHQTISLNALCHKLHSSQSSADYIMLKGVCVQNAQQNNSRSHYQDWGAEIQIFYLNYLLNLHSSFCASTDSMHEKVPAQEHA